MKIVLAPEGKTGKLLFSLYGPDGTKRQCYTFKPTSLKDQKQVCKDAGIAPEVLLRYCEDVGQFAKEFSLAPPTKSESELILRTIEQPRHLGRSVPLSSWRQALTEPRETLLDWSDKDALCCLDVDYHLVTPPSAEWIETSVLSRLVPRPAVWHLSRSGGLHAFYTPASGLTAQEVAALAAIRWKAIDPSAQVELKTQVRAAGGSTINESVGYENANTFLTEWAGLDSTDSTDERVQSYLDSAGLEIGQRYPHEQCPIEPGVPSERNPVTVGEDGIYCHRCAGKGMTLGSTKPGYVPWSRLIGVETAGYLRTMIRNRTHWGHAKWVIEAMLGLTGTIPKLAYGAALRLRHGPEGDAGVFHPDTDCLVRFPGRWGTVAEGYTFPRDIRPLLQALPVAICPDTGKPSASRVARLEQPTLDHTDLGYPAIETVGGFKLAGYRNAYRDVTRLVIATPAPWLRAYGTAFYPRYVPGTKDVAAAKATLESVLPGIHWDYLYALIAARGCNEGRIGKQQHLVVTGVSRSAKTGHVHLAAGVLGEVVSSIPFTADIERFRSAIRDSSRNGGFLSFDEFIKDSLRLNPRLSAEQVLDPLLNLTPNSMSHQLYLGPTALGHPGVCVWTETFIPERLRDYTQIARRVHFLKLVRKVDWESGLAAAGINEIQLIRTISPDLATACNIILSDVVDRFFQVLVPFEEVAGQLGVPTLEKSPDFTDPREKHLRLFQLVCEAPNADPVSARRFKGPGYKIITKADDTELAELWTDLADAPVGKGWQQSGRLAEKDWAEVLGCKQPVFLDTQSDGSRVAIRFRVGAIREPLAVNQEIIRE